jgi:hypothetical protein
MKVIKTYQSAIYFDEKLINHRMQDSHRENPADSKHSLALQSEPSRHGYILNFKITLFNISFAL